MGAYSLRRTSSANGFFSLAPFVWSQRSHRGSIRSVSPDQPAPLDFQALGTPRVRIQLIGVPVDQILSEGEAVWTTGERVSGGGGA